MTHLRSAALLVLVLALPWAIRAQAIAMGGNSYDFPRLMRLQASAVASR
jgi:hypothetical protein